MQRFREKQGFDSSRVSLTSLFEFIYKLIYKKKVQYCEDT